MCDEHFPKTQTKTNIVSQVDNLYVMKLTITESWPIRFSMVVKSRWFSTLNQSASSFAVNVHS